MLLIVSIERSIVRNQAWTRQSTFVDSLLNNEDFATGISCNTHPLAHSHMCKYWSESGVMIETFQSQATTLFGIPSCKINPLQSTTTLVNAAQILSTIEYTKEHLRKERF